MHQTRYIFSATGINTGLIPMSATARTPDQSTSALQCLSLSENVIRATEPASTHFPFVSWEVRCSSLLNFHPVLRTLNCFAKTQVRPSVMLFRTCPGRQLIRNRYRNSQSVQRRCICLDSAMCGEAVERRDRHRDRYVTSSRVYRVQKS